MTVQHKTTKDSLSISAFAARVSSVGSVRDLLIIGAGPAGRALAFRATRAGLEVALIDPAPTRRLHATYGMWADEIPDWLPSDVVAARGPAVVYTPRRRELQRDYAILSNDALMQSLSQESIELITGTVLSADATGITCTDRRRERAMVVVDTRPQAVPATWPTQTAFGVIVGRHLDREPDETNEMVLMDWRGDRGSFCYAVDLDSERRLIEETCLAGRPGTAPDVLAERLRGRDRRLKDFTYEKADDHHIEIVDFPLLSTDPSPWRSRPEDPPRFGAAGGLMHPATGYSVAASLRSTDLVVDAVISGVDVTEALWPHSARAVHRLRIAGLNAILGFDAYQLPVFFDAFFSLPPRLQRAYLSDRTDLAGMLQAMGVVFARVPMAMRRRLVWGAGTGLAGIGPLRR